MFVTYKRDGDHITIYFNDVHLFTIPFFHRNEEPPCKKQKAGPTELDSAKAAELLSKAKQEKKAKQKQVKKAKQKVQQQTVRSLLKAK